MSYAKALPPSRATTDLSALNAEARDTLLCMSDDELKALSRGGIRAARLFVSGRDHGIHGVPIVRLSRAKIAVGERKKWKARAQAMQPTRSMAFR